MKNSPPAEGVEITQLLKRHKNGDAEALEQLMPHIYHELRRIAQFHLRSNGTGSTLQPTALVNEAYLQLFDGHSIDWQNRAHFFNVIGRQMRWLVVDHARRTHAKKRGGMTTKISIEDVTIANSQSRQNIDFLALDQALNRLETMYPRVGKVVELRYFVGLNELQTAEILEISDRQVRRDWAFAKGWLLDQLQSINRNDER